MQRRAFSFSAASLALAGSSLPVIASAQAPAFQSGKDYLVVGKPALTDAPAGKIEVAEFFWYNCPHCNEFEPMFDAWTKKAPKNISVRRVPVAFRADFEPQQRLYYVLEGLGKIDDLHKKVFNAIHNEKQQLNKLDQITAWVEKQGIPKAKFLELYNSFSIATKVRKATQLQDAYMVDGVPALGINGRYFTSATQARTMERALQVTDYLVAQSASAK